MLLINASNLYVGGGMQVGISVINELTLEGTPFIAAVSPPVFEQLSEAAKINTIIIEKSPSGMFNFSVRRALDALVVTLKIEKVFTIFGPSYWSPKVSTHLVGFALPWLIYDTGAIYNKLTIKEKLKKIILSYIQPYFFKKNASALVCETQDVNEKISVLLKFDPKKIFTVSNTIADVYSNESLYDLSILKKLPKKNENDVWLLSISHNYPHKNLHCIKSLINILPDNYKFITTLDKDFLTDLPDESKKRVITLGAVTIYQCPPLYIASDALFLPTLLECYSASYAEAMYMCKTILTSDRSFAKTICGNAAFYFDPLDNADIASKILLASNDSDAREHKLLVGKEISNATPNARQRAQKYMSILNGI
jgi:hypothetical protein